MCMLNEYHMVVNNLIVVYFNLNSSQQEEKHLVNSRKTIQSTGGIPDDRKLVNFPGIMESGILEEKLLSHC